ncbi:ATP-binding protein [bacterium]|nr:ATP-binding protein [bacterium]
MSTPAKQIFESLNTEADLMTFINRQPEVLHVDYKTKRDHTTGEVDDDLRKTLGKGIAGFANAEGGVLIIGIDAPQDTLPTLKPILPIVEFEQEVNTQIPRSTSFPVEGVLTKPVSLTSQPGGVLLVYVPQSDLAPHRSQKDHRYYQRIGDSFLPMEHYQVADMFGRRYQPNLIAYVDMRAIVEQRNSQARIEIKLGIRNSGRAIARFPLLLVDEIGGFQLSTFGLSGNGHFGLLPFPNSANLRQYKGGADDVIHPGISFPVNIADQNVAINSVQEIEKFGKWQLKGRVVSEGFPLKNWTISIADEFVQEAILSPKETFRIEGQLQ